VIPAVMASLDPAIHPDPAGIIGSSSATTTDCVEIHSRSACAMRRVAVRDDVVDADDAIDVIKVLRHDANI